jgi:mannose-6-phosphate isomerase
VEILMSALAARTAELTTWLTDAALPLWWEAGADHQCGGFHETLDEQGRPIAANRRARVQARQIYVYATAGQFGWAGPWREAVAHGLDFFLGHYQRPDGYFRTLVAPDGASVDEAAWLYDQAFALFALAQAWRVMPERTDLPARALALFKTIQAWRMPEGGFREPPAHYNYQSNPHMHLLEAMLTWAEIDDDPAWNAAADEIVALAMSRFVDANGALHEFFGPGWLFADGVGGRIIEPGHQFEWSWLLERWARLHGREDAHQAALKMFAVGKSGIDARRGVATQQLLDDGSVHDDVARLWPQTEWIKAAVIFGDNDAAIAAVDGLKLYLEKPLAGLWWDKLMPAGGFFPEPSPASSFYHIVCGIAELSAAAVDRAGFSRG